jgi:hypothetical protein
VWVQQIALGWLVYDMTRKASLLGAIADRASRSAIMLGTLSVIATTALALSAAHRNGPHRGVAHRRDLLRGAGPTPR